MFAYINLNKPVYDRIIVKTMKDTLKYPGWGDPTNIKKRHSAYDTIKNPKKYKSDYERIKNADLKYPIIMTETGYIVDGAHRIAKAYLNKEKTIKVYIFDEKLMKKFIIAKNGEWDKVDKMNVHNYIIEYIKNFKLKEKKKK